MRGGSPTIQRGKAEAVQVKEVQKGEDRRQYRRKRQRLYKPERHIWGMITGNTERKGRGYTNQEGTKGGIIADNIERKGIGNTNQEAIDEGG